MNCNSFIPALVIHSDGSGGGTVGPPGKDGKDGKDGRDGVNGKDGAVYVPHIDERHVLTFTLEQEPTDPPPPIDLDPSDEWGSIDETEISSGYVWETL